MDESKPQRIRTQPYTEKRGAAFLKVLEETGCVKYACKLSKLPRQTAYDRRATDSAFAAMWDAALEKGTDALEDEAIRRASLGTERPVYQGGKKVGTVQEFSDTLLIFMLKARRPEKFKDRHQHDIAGNLAVTQLTDEQLNARIAELAGKAGIGMAPGTEGVTPTSKPH